MCLTTCVLSMVVAQAHFTMVSKIGDKWWNKLGQLCPQHIKIVKCWQCNMLCDPFCEYLESCSLTTPLVYHALWAQGVDCSYHIQTNVSLRRSIVQGIIVHNICMRERYYCFLVCTYEKAINIVEVKIDVQKRALRFREKTNNRCVSFIQLTLSSTVVIP